MRLEELQERLKNAGYLATPEIVGMVQLAQRLGRPLLMEGPAGAGKTALATALAQAFEWPLMRLQCYEGLDASQALYDWNYARQLADLAQHRDRDPFQPAYLLARPLLKALMEPRGAVLLVDEIDRADEAFEALLLEVLAERQVTIPELGTVKAKGPVLSVLTSNRTRSLSDALRRRCLFQPLDWPEPGREEAILALHWPDSAAAVRATLVRVMGVLRQWELVKPPGLSESLDLLGAVTMAGLPALDAFTFRRFLGTVIKDRADWTVVEARIPELFEAG